MRRGVSVIAAVGLVIGLAACGSTGATGSTTASATITGPAHGAVGQAMRLLPSSAGRVYFVDQRQALTSLGLKDVTGATAKDSQAYAAFADKTRKTGALSNLVPYVGAMKDWSWNALDVDWEAGTIGSGPPLTIDRIRDGLDMKGIVESFIEHGFRKKSAGDLVELTAPGGITQKGVPIVAFTSGVTVIPDQHLVIYGGGTSEYAVPDVANSFAGRGSVNALTKDLTDPQRLDVAVGKSACATAPSSVTASLKTLTGWSLAVDGPKHATVVAAYAFADDASADRSARERLLKSGTDGDGGKYSDDVTASVRVDRADLLYDLSEQVPARLSAMEARGDVPWAFCGA